MQQKNTNILSKIFLKASPFHLHSQSSITHYKFQKKKKTTPLFSSPNPRSHILREDQGWPFSVANKFIKLHRIATRSKGLPFVGQNRCAPLNDARRHLCDGKLTPPPPHGRKGGKSCLLRTKGERRKRRTAGIKISKPNKFTGARHCRDTIYA